MCIFMHVGVGYPKRVQQPYICRVAKSVYTMYAVYTVHIYCLYGPFRRFIQSIYMYIWSIYTHLPLTKRMSLRLKTGKEVGSTGFYLGGGIRSKLGSCSYFIFFVFFAQKLQVLMWEHHTDDTLVGSLNPYYYLNMYGNPIS
jgi:hypothetical protein